jgi:biopolymer transport protein ExbD
MLDEILDASVRIVIDAQNGVTLDDEPVNDLTLLADSLRGTGKTEAILEIDRRALHETVVKVVDACNEAGMQKIRIAGRSGEG